MHDSHTFHVLLGASTSCSQLPFWTEFWLAGYIFDEISRNSDGMLLKPSPLFSESGPVGISVRFNFMRIGGNTRFLIRFISFWERPLPVPGYPSGHNSDLSATIFDKILRNSNLVLLKSSPLFSESGPVGISVRFNSMRINGTAWIPMRFTSFWERPLPVPSYLSG